jgi:hypothetical protein
VSGLIFADSISSATTVIKRPTDVVWPILLDQASWMTEFRLETVEGEPNREGEVKKATSFEPHPEYHPFFFKTLLLIPFRKFVYKAYTEKRSGKYGFTGIEALSLNDLGKDSAVVFEGYFEFQSWTMTREELADFVHFAGESSKAMWERNFQRLGSLASGSGCK